MKKSIKEPIPCSIKRRNFVLLSAYLFGCAACTGSIRSPISKSYTISSLAELRSLSDKDYVTVTLQPGTYTLDSAESHCFISFSGKSSHFIFHGVTLKVDTQLFSQFGTPIGKDGFYRVIDIKGDNTILEGLTIVTVGDKPGIQSRNKIVNITGKNSILKNVDITTSGSQPWGYGSLFGISGGAIRKLNGIRVGWPASGVQLIGCRVHMRAMGHGIFVQGATATLIQDCHVDGLLRSTNDILKETSGFAFEHAFSTSNTDYVEGVKVSAVGRIIPNEIIALSEDGIRLYDQFDGHLTGQTTIKNCTVRRMRRGICTGLGRAFDTITNCETTECVAAGFNIGSGDTLKKCRSDAIYAEALSCPYNDSYNANVDLEILNSRETSINNLLATINGQNHKIKIYTSNQSYVSNKMLIALGTTRGYAFYQKDTKATKGIKLVNNTSAKIIFDSA